jgi:hypothetical protein
VVKRSSEERKRLPPELEAFARSDEEKLRLRRPRVDRGKVRDPREGYTVAGVANRDARAVYDVRVERMRGLWSGGQASPEALDQLGEELLDTLRLTLWRARRVMGFESFAEDVLSVPAARARELAAAAALRTGETADPLDERTVALWMRTEAGLFEGDPQARVRLAGAGTERRIHLSLPVSVASAGLAGAGARHAPLAREQADRPTGPVRTPRAALERPEPAVGPESEPPMAVDEAEVEVVPSEPPPAAQPPAGGARLLTRKVRRDEPEAESEVQEPAAPEPVRERPRRFEGESPRKFGRERPGGERPRKLEGERPRRFEGERPRSFERERPRKKFETTNGDRPAKFEADRPRKKFDTAKGEGPRKKFDSSQAERPRKKFETGGRKLGERTFGGRSQGDAGGRARFGAGKGKPGDKPRFGGKQERPAGRTFGGQRGGFGQKRAFGKGKGDTGGKPRERDAKKPRDDGDDNDGE